MLIYEEVDNKCKEYLLENFTTELRTGYVKCKGHLLPNNFKNFGDEIESMKVRDDDIWVCTFPKTGKLPIYCSVNVSSLQSRNNNL